MTCVSAADNNYVAVSVFMHDGFFFFAPLCFYQANSSVALFGNIAKRKQLHPTWSRYPSKMASKMQSVSETVF
jgi:hypothetical protein